jgi:hypothetical protein
MKASVFQGPPAYVLLAGSSEVRCASNGTGTEKSVATGYWEDVGESQLGIGVQNGQNYPLVI